MIELTISVNKKSRGVRFYGDLFIKAPELVDLMDKVSFSQGKTPKRLTLPSGSTHKYYPVSTGQVCRNSGLSAQLYSAYFDTPLYFATEIDTTWGKSVYVNSALFGFAKARTGLSLPIVGHVDALDKLDQVEFSIKRWVSALRLILSGGTAGDDVVSVSPEVPIDTDSLVEVKFCGKFSHIQAVQKASPVPEEPRISIPKIHSGHRTIRF